MTLHSTERTKPLLRGVSHQVAFYVALVAGGALTALSPAGRPTLAASIYSACLAALFGISAAYHRPTWNPVQRQWMRRLDHAGIYLQIAGTYTPICMLAVPAPAGVRLLWMVWAGALLGIFKSLVWIRAPKALSALLYVLLGWAVVSEWTVVRAGVGDRGLTLLLVGGVLYTLGAVVYARKSPDPWPKVFGYHEIFHVLVIAAALCHYAIVLRLVVT
jgi:hemolysin III